LSNTSCSNILTSPGFSFLSFFAELVVGRGKCVSLQSILANGKTLFQVCSAKQRYSILTTQAFVADQSFPFQNFFSRRQESVADQSFPFQNFFSRRQESTTLQDSTNFVASMFCFVTGTATNNRATHTTQRTDGKSRTVNIWTNRVCLLGLTTA